LRSHRPPPPVTRPPTPASHPCLPRHAFVVKFNHISPTVYSRFTSTLCHSMSPQLQQHARRHVRRALTSAAANHLGRQAFSPVHWWRGALAEPLRRPGPNGRLRCGREDRPTSWPLPPPPWPHPSSAPTLLTTERPPKAACGCMAVHAGSLSRVHSLRQPEPPCMHCTCTVHGAPCTVHPAPCTLHRADFSRPSTSPGAAAEPAEHAAPLGHRVLPRGK
jgi:hypothetical protein